MSLWTIQITYWFNNYCKHNYVTVSNNAIIVVLMKEILFYIKWETMHTMGEYFFCNYLWGVIDSMGKNFFCKFMFSFEGM